VSALMAQRPGHGAEKTAFISGQTLRMTAYIKPKQGIGEQITGSMPASFMESIV
jgi:hypothetical protein